MHVCIRDVFYHLILDSLQQGNINDVPDTSDEFSMSNGNPQCTLVKPFIFNQVHLLDLSNLCMVQLACNILPPFVKLHTRTRQMISLFIGSILCGKILQRFS